ncbi:putative late blight resistance protein homolog R1B-17 [Coffea eugenioides]|uniref:putative late blight resistance protein homolog R1B-17 n=1 Tax=Coffea eugenioides TaxID=49369 RepID=UPI000F60AF9E|nr:putative late blight resistance protein homolog R1B-17 [Coffea eugenioides]
MASICIDSILDELELLDSHPSKDVDLVGLKPVPVAVVNVLFSEMKSWNSWIPYWRFWLILGVDHSQLEKLLIHCEAVAVISALFLHDTSDWREVFEILEKIKPVDPQVREIYIHVLMDSKSFEISHSLTVEAGNCSILVNFVDSRLGCLWELQDNSNIFVASAKYQMQMLYKGLKFLNNILKHQQEEFTVVHEKTKDLIEGVIKEAGIVIFSLYIQEMELGSAREIDVALFTILQQIEIIKAEVAEKYPVKSALNYPSASEVDFIDLILENLNELASHEVSSTAFTTDRLQTVQEDLVILRTFFGNILEQCNQHEQLQALWCHFAEMGHKAELVIDTLMLGEIFSSSVVSFDTTTQEIVLLKNRTLEIVDNNYVLETQKDLKTPRHVASQGTISTINEAVVVLDDETQAIIDQLTRVSMHLDIVSIVGMPGLGKTTLARTVFHDPSIMSHFYIHAWCCISQVDCKKDLLLDILVCIASTNSDKYYKMNEDDLAEQLYKRLKGRRYVIVLDDVWDIEVWNLLERSFPDDANGSRILLTSRLFEVALLIKPTGILGTLELDGWKEVAERLSSHIVFGTDQCMSILG